jgi:hypothetical protein
MRKEITVNFGAIPMPPGYRVIWSPWVEHYLWVNDAGDEGVIYCNRFDARRDAIAHAAARTPTTEAPGE